MHSYSHILMKYVGKGLVCTKFTAWMAFFIYTHLCPHIIFILDTSEPCSILTSFTMQRHSWLIFCAAHRVWRFLGTWTFSLFGDDWHHLLSSLYPGNHSSNRLDLFTYAIWNKIQIRDMTKGKHECVISPSLGGSRTGRKVLCIHLGIQKTNWKKINCSHFSNILALIKDHSFALSNFVLNHLTHMCWWKVHYSIMFLNSLTFNANILAL